jgi:hypothetical protein
VTDKIRLADHPPVFCAACFNADHEIRHVDFDAAADRGYGLRPGQEPISMDEIVLCERCVTLGAKLLGLEDVRPHQRTAERLEERIGELQGERDRAVEYADKMEDAIGSRPERIDGRKMRRPREPVA